MKMNNKVSNSVEKKEKLTHLEVYGIIKKNLLEHINKGSCSVSLNDVSYFNGENVTGNVLLNKNEKNKDFVLGYGMFNKGNGGFSITYDDTKGYLQLQLNKKDEDGKWLAPEYLSIESVELKKDQNEDKKFYQVRFFEKDNDGKYTVDKGYLFIDWNIFREDKNNNTSNVEKKEEILKKDKNIDNVEEEIEIEDLPF